jgi:hypothetical protein
MCSRYDGGRWQSCEQRPHGLPGGGGPRPQDGAEAGDRARDGYGQYGQAPGEQGNAGIVKQIAI